MSNWFEGTVMCNRELIVDSASHGIEHLTVSVLRIAVSEGFIPCHDWVRECAQIVSTGEAPDASQYHDQGELFDQALEHLNDTVPTDQYEGSYFEVDDNSLWMITLCDDSDTCDSEWMML